MFANGLGSESTYAAVGLTIPVDNKKQMQWLLQWGIQEQKGQTKAYKGQFAALGCTTAVGSI